MISFDDFSKVEIKVGTVIDAEELEGSDKLFKLKVDFVLEAERVEGSDKLIKQIVDFGDERRQVLSGIRKWYKPESLVGKQFIYVTNLEPRVIMGLESQAMILATDTDPPILLKLSKKAPSGVKVR